MCVYSFCIDNKLEPNMIKCYQYFSLGGSSTSDFIFFFRVF